MAKGPFPPPHQRRCWPSSPSRWLGGAVSEMDTSYYGGRPKRVVSQASDLHRRVNGITPFDCPRDNWLNFLRCHREADSLSPRSPDHRLAGRPSSPAGVRYLAGLGAGPASGRGQPLALGHHQERSANRPAFSKKWIRCWRRGLGGVPPPRRPVAKPTGRQVTEFVAEAERRADTTRAETLAAQAGMSLRSPAAAVCRVPRQRRDLSESGDDRCRGGSCHVCSWVRRVGVGWRSGMSAAAPRSSGPATTRRGRRGTRGRRWCGRSPPASLVWCCAPTAARRGACRY
jgi:hypothetical protein